MNDECCLILSQEDNQAVGVLISLSPLISEELVPIKNWISTVAYLISRCFKRSSHESKLHSTIHSICMACTSPSHVRSLVNEGILGYWERVLMKGEGVQDTRVTVLEAISHLTAIDKKLSFKIDGQ
jgi:hypothetical protein